MTGNTRSLVSLAVLRLPNIRGCSDTFPRADLTPQFSSSFTTTGELVNPSNLPGALTWLPSSKYRLHETEGAMGPIDPAWDRTGIHSCFPFG